MGAGAPKPPKPQKLPEPAIPDGDQPLSSPPALKAAAAPRAGPRKYTDQPGLSNLGAWERYKAIAQLLDLVLQAGEGEIGDAARTALLRNLNLEERFNSEVMPAMDLIAAAKKDLGDQWAYGIFLPSFDSSRQAKLLGARRVSENGVMRCFLFRLPCPSLAAASVEWVTGSVCCSFM